MSKTLSLSESDVKLQVRRYILESLLMSSAGQELGDDTSLLRRAIIDSTGVIELVTHLEESFAITIDDEEMVPANLDSINRITRFVQRKTQQQLEGTAA
jgi:acyl carrier protein